MATAQTPIAAAARRVGKQRGVWHLQHNGIDRMAGEKIPGLVRIPSGKIDRGPVLERMSHGVKYLRLDPEGIAGRAGPDA